MTRGRFAFRGRPRTHEPKRTGHWQRGNIALAPILQVSTSLDEAYQVLELAAIPNLLGDYATAVGRAQANQIKFVEVGGLVFDYQFVASGQRSTTTFFETGLDCFAQFLLFSDRLDELGNPTALTANWFTNTTPVVTETATETQDEDTRYPTRVHYRHAHCISFDEVDSSIAANFLANPLAVRSQGSKSLRTRLRLDDEHALCAGFHLATDNQFPSEGYAITVKLMLIGSIYYRVVYQ